MRSSEDSGLGDLFSAAQRAPRVSRQVTLSNAIDSLPRRDQGLHALFRLWFDWTLHSDGERILWLPSITISPFLFRDPCALVNNTLGSVHWWEQIDGSHSHLAVTYVVFTDEWKFTLNRVTRADTAKAQRAARPDNRPSVRHTVSSVLRPPRSAP